MDGVVLITPDNSGRCLAERVPTERFLRDYDELGAFKVPLMLWGIATFARHRTAVMPHLPARRLVTGGPYRFTRNPMYTGMTLAYVGGCAIVGTGGVMTVSR